MPHKKKKQDQQVNLGDIDKEIADGCEIITLHLIIVQKKMNSAEIKLFLHFVWLCSFRYFHYRCSRIPRPRDSPCTDLSADLSAADTLIILFSKLFLCLR